MSGEILTGIKEILALIIANYGPYGTIGLFLVVYVLLWIKRLYDDYKKKKEENEVIAEKERTVQRLANEVRMWRTLELKEKRHWTDEQIERFLITEDFANPAEANKYFNNRKKEIENKGDKKNG